ncbi:hypothetical protein JSE7799_01405 [Jannaschia seosinensis]|uniref:Uncharacterized protein n=1 Tax=Jannaschia seosinensis TaxID=313367 RepID=A0A0M7B9F2_9RHOB|nr:hypothetical protein [Jannaschia seosinensis]CUH38386.1 hypothetical protein JSE7799_01405 [Jannaschia seosinensis]
MPIELLPRDPRIHVFAVSDGALKLPHQTYLSQMREEPGETPLSEAFGAEIDATYAEVFAVRDVHPIGLRTYLAQAHDIPDVALAPDAAKLDALSGDVVVLAPRAVEGVDKLELTPELTHIGSYAPAEADMSQRAVPRSTDVPPTPRDSPEEPARRGLGTGTIVWIVVAALVLAALLVVLA